MVAIVGRNGVRMVLATPSSAPCVALAQISGGIVPTHAHGVGANQVRLPPLLLRIY